MSELKPCIKCGSSDVQHYWLEPEFAETECHECQCNQCGLSSGEFLTFELLLLFWNNRQPTIAEYLESQKVMLDKTGAKMVTVESLKEFAGL